MKDLTNTERKDLVRALKDWMIDYRVRGEESWCQVDRVNEALPYLGELIGEHLGYPTPADLGEEE